MSEPDREAMARSPEPAPDGLLREGAQRRLAERVHNELPEPRVSASGRLLGHFPGPIPWAIEMAAANDGVELAAYRVFDRGERGLLQQRPALVHR